MTAPTAEHTASVADISDASLVERAVQNCRARKRYKQPRWVAVSENFALGSTYSRQLCRRFGLDPDQMVSR
jgi:hypothetical protein